MSADEDAVAFLAAQHLVGRRGSHSCEVGRPDVEPAATAALVLDRTDPDATELCAEAVVEREEGCRDIGRQRLSLAAGFVLLLHDAFLGDVSGRGRLRNLAFQVAQLDLEPLQRRLCRLQALEDIDLDVLEVADPALDRLQLVLHGLQLLGVGHLAGIDPLPVAGSSALDLLDVGVRLALLQREVVDLGAVATPRRRQIRLASGQGVQRCCLGQVAQPVFEQVEGAVDRLQVEQLELGGGFCFQRRLLCQRRMADTSARMSGTTAWFQGSVHTVDTWHAIG